MKLDLIAVTEGVGARGYLNFWQVRKLANPLQLVPYEVFF